MQVVRFAVLLAFVSTSCACSGGGGGGAPALPAPSQVANGGTTVAPAPAPLTTSTAVPTTAPTAAPVVSPAPTPAISTSTTTAPPAASTPFETATPVQQATSPSTPPMTVPTAAAASGGLANVRASSSDAFVSTMGVDVDLVSPSDSQQGRIATDFRGLGVRRTRVAILESDAHYGSVVRNFVVVNPGASALGLTNCSPPLGAYARAAIGPQDVRDFIASTGITLNAVEGVNEPDARGDASWAADTRSCLAPLAGGVDGIPLVGPAVVTHSGGGSEAALGDLSGQIQMTNVHRYFSGRNPATTGWGGSDACGRYGGLDWQICWAARNAPQAPVVVSETGWNSDSEVDEATQAKYVERLFFVNAQAGIAETSLYELESYAGGDGFGGCGLVRVDGSEKPAYLAVAAMTTLLSDPGPPFGATSLPIAIAPSSADGGAGLRSMLLAKRNGTFELALWQEVPSADPNARASDIAVPALNVTVRVGSPYAGTLHAWADDGRAPALPLGRQTSFAVPVTDRLTVLELAP